MKKMIATLLMPLTALLGASAQAAPPGAIYYSDYLKQQAYYDYRAQAAVPESFRLTPRAGAPARTAPAGYHAPIEDKGYLNWFFLSLALASVGFIIYKKT